jgi:MFS family permease
MDAGGARRRAVSGAAPSTGRPPPVRDRPGSPGADEGAATPLFTAGLVILAAVTFLGMQVPHWFAVAPAWLATRGLGETAIGLIMGALNAAALAGMPLAGWAVQRRGHRAVLAASCAVGAAGALLFALDHQLLLLLARTLQGIGFAGVLVASLVYAAALAPPERLGQALGLAGVVTLLAQAVGPACAELLARHAGWNWVFAGAALCGAAGALAARHLPVLDRAIPAAPAHAEPGPGRPALAPLAAMFLAGLGGGAVFTFLADHGPRAGTPLVSPFFAASAVASIGSRVGLGHLTDASWRRVTAVVSLLLQGGALLLLADLHGTGELILAGALFGTGHGLYYPALQAMIIEAASAARRARAVSRSTLAYGAGSAAGAVLLGAVAAACGYPAIYWLSAAAAAVGALAAAGARR